MTGTERGLNETAPHCKHFVTRKKRFCRMTVKVGLEFCGEHLPKSEDVESNIPDSQLRISCPLDSNHTCYASKLHKHLKKCNAKIDTSVPYIIPGINSKRSEYIDNPNRQLIDVPVSHISEVIQKVNKIYNDFIKDSISVKVLNHKLLNEEVERSDYGVNTRKHILQASSLLAHMQAADLIQSKTCFVEFGAGKGQLSYWVSTATNSVPQTSVLLVERACLRHKKDNKLDKSENNVHRIRADIANLILHKVDVVKESEHIVGFTKHLCGDATDLALHCLMNSSKEKNISGVVMAFCCHHRCHWSEYIGKTFFQENHLSPSDFDVICGMVSWATCGTGQSRSKQTEKHNTNKLENQQTTTQFNNRDTEIGLTRQEKEVVGKKCKLVIDYGRYWYLKQNGFKCSLFYYVPPSVSLENVCLVASK